VESVELSFRRLRGNKVLVGEEAVLTPGECQKLAERSEALAKKVHTADPQTLADLVSLGKAVGGGPEAPFSVDDCAQGPESTVLCIRPQRDVRDWRLIEGIAWETAAGSHGGLINMGHVLVRGYPGSAPPPFDLGDREPRMLFIGCSPESRMFPALDVARSRNEVAAAWTGCTVAPEWRAVEGPDTMRRLRELLESDPEWSYVHVTAHGFRDNGTICLESPDGKEDYQEFSALAEELRRLRDPRLFTLHVCGSSRLAIEIAFRHPHARVIGTLYEARQEFLYDFFALLYRHLFQSGPASEVYVEEVFRRTVQQLEQSGNLGWFLPVLYGPAQLGPFVDRGAELSLQDILRSVEAGELEAARTAAVSCLRNPKPVVKVKAAHFLSNIDGLRAFGENFEELERDIATQAGTDAPDWAGLHEKWKQFSFIEKTTSGPGSYGAPGSSTAIAVLPWFEGFYEDWNALKEAVLDALQRLARFQKGALRDLLEGCRALLGLGSSRHRPTLQSASSRSFALGLRQLVAQVRSVIPVHDAEVSRSEMAERIGRGLQLVIDAREILDEGARDLLDGPTVEGLRREMDEQVDRARAAAARLRRGGGPPEALLDPSRRLELCRWVLRPGEEPAGEAPELPAGDARSLLDFCRKAVETAQERRAAVDFRSLPPECVPLLVNQAAPFVLATELAEPITPYLCLATLDARPDSPARQISEDVEYRAGAEGDAEFRGVLLQAVAELTDARKRLCLDAQLLPCGNVEECTRRFHRIADLVFHGHSVPEDLFEGVVALDRAALLAVAGRTEEAASLGAEYAHQHLHDADALRAGCLLGLHHASVLPPDSEQLAPTLRQAMALLGILLGGPEPLREWIGRRFAVYQQVVPADLTEHVEAVSNRLQAEVTRRLYRLEEQGGELGDLTRALRQELQAELDGARVAATSARAFFKGPRGGYHAARMTGGLRQPGHDLAATYRRLASLDGTEYLTYVTATGMSVELFHQLVFLFSDLRRAWVAPGDDVLPLVQDLLPEREELEVALDAPPGVAAALAAHDCRDRFPFHAALGPGAEATRALASHAAIVAIESYYQQGKRLLAAERLNRARLVTALDATLALDRYVVRLDYPLADKCLDSLSRLEELCTNWVRSVEKHVVTTWDSPKEAEGLRSLCEETLGLADHLSERYSFARGDFRAAQGSLHRQCGVLGANRFRDGNAALRHLRKAYQCDPESAGIVINYLRACRMAHFQSPAGSQEGKQALGEGIRAAEEFLRAPTTGDRAQVEQDLKELREVRDRATGGPASPDFFPRLIEPEKMDD